MSRTLVVGSGPTGVHLAQTLLEAGQAVTMLDVGHEKPAAVLPDADFDGLKVLLDDPASYFLREDGSAVVFPGERSKLYAFPPSKDYVFSVPRRFAASLADFEPLISFAAGGLAEAWTGGCYPLNDAELADFPFGFEDLRPHYAEIIRRIGITAEHDDLERFSPWLDGYSDSLELDAHSAYLLTRYRNRRSTLNGSLGFHLGRSRVAVLGHDLGERRACDQLGRCLWGCPRDALYTPSSTLRQLRRQAGFTYVPGMFVTHFQHEEGEVRGIAAVDSAGAERSFSADAYALAAGALNSSKILLESLYRSTGRAYELGGLMDNLQIMMPFVTLGRLGHPATTHAYQFHQIALGIERPRPDEYVHGQVTTLKSASVHPIVQNMPLDLRSALDVFRMTHAALGVANVWLHDRPDDSNVVTVRPRRSGGGTELVVRYAPRGSAHLAEVLSTLKRALRRLGCIVPPGMTKILPSGSSVHYAGTVPMTAETRELTCTPECRSRDFRNLWFADSVTFPFLPAKNLTFTAMANAVRVGKAIARDSRT